MTTLKLGEFCGRDEQTCDYYSEVGCCNGMIHQSGGQDSVLKQGRCTYAKIEGVFGLMTEEGFTKDECDPDGLNRAASAMLQKALDGLS
ncbi:hypothetical protein KKF03_00250 [Patescibacteria group bacterium]|nr:hypothetical protein [Patescibacteria group bacterium]MBU1910836.1 hypothetical protein [Patescibacteria group bacterium]